MSALIQQPFGEPNENCCRCTLWRPVTMKTFGKAGGQIGRAMGGAIELFELENGTSAVFAELEGVLT